MVLNVKIFSVILARENIIPVMLIALLLCAFIVNGISTITCNGIKFKLMFYFLIVITLIWTIAQNKIADLYFISAILFGITAMIITNIKLSQYWVAITSLVLGLFLYRYIDISSWLLESDAGEKMYYSYLVLPFILFSIYGLSLYIRDSYVIILSIINLIIYLPILFGIGVRGVFISLLIYFALFFINTSFFQKKAKLIINTIIILLIFIFSIDWVDLIERLSAWLASHDIQIYVLEKYLLMFAKEDVSNGRFELYRNAIDGFLNSPIWGNGFGVFEINNDGQYVHNIFLEILYEGGVLLSIFFIYVFYRFGLLIIKRKSLSKEYYLFVILLFVIGCSTLLFSNTLWRVVSFWMFTGIILNNIKYASNK